MDIMELGAIGELVGGVAVIGSLIYVGLQVRQTNRQAKDAAAVTATNQYDRFMEMIVTDAKAREMWIIGTGGGAKALSFTNPANLNVDDLTLLAFVMARAWHNFEGQYLAWKSGTLGDEQWSKLLPFIHQHLSGEAGLDCWKIQREGWHSEGFRSFVDGEVQKLQSAGTAQQNEE